ncbi:MAG: hypothetical protein IJ265_00880 [Oscillospiraceae bacterium]|nr:hypothetical protein [Oscillospiraceae bacterium]
MAKSKIIKDLANSTIDIHTALKRAKVLFSELNNNELLHWVENELVGYKKYEDLPDYRKLEGDIFGSYLEGFSHRFMRYTNASIPLGNMSEEIKKGILTVYIFDGVEALKNLALQSATKEGHLSKNINADALCKINECNNNPFMKIDSAYVNIGSHSITNIISIIENRLLDALILLEKEFGCLDELDLSDSNKT